MFKDNRGIIEQICENADVLKITSKKGSRRANHYHKSTGHWCYITKGEIIMLERPVGSKEKPTRVVYKQNELVWTGPNVEHLMLFENFDENEFLCFSTGKRDQKSYEDDLVRLEFDLDKE